MGVLARRCYVLTVPHVGVAFRHGIPVQRVAVVDGQRQIVLHIATILVDRIEDGHSTFRIESAVPIITVADRDGVQIDGLAFVDGQLQLLGEVATILVGGMIGIETAIGIGCAMPGVGVACLYGFRG